MDSNVWHAETVGLQKLISLFLIAFSNPLNHFFNFCDGGGVLVCQLALEQIKLECSKACRQANRE